MIKKNGFVFIKSFRSSSALESVFIERPMYLVAMLCIENNGWQLFIRATQ